MTTRTRRPSGKAADEKADKPAEQAAEQAPAQPAEQADEKDAGDGDGGDTVGSRDINAPAGPTTAQLTQVQTTAQGEPQPAEVDRGLVNPETGVSPAFGEDGVVHVDGEGDHFGEPSDIGVDKSGEHRHGAAPAAHGDHPGNGQPQLGDRSGSPNTGGREDRMAAGDGTAVLGVGGTAPAPAFEGPTYPATTLTRESSKAAPVEPADVRRATEPAQGYVQSSTDPIAAAAAIGSMTGEEGTGLVLSATGESVKPSQVFEVPDEPGLARGFRRANARVSEVYNVRRVKTPSRRLLFVEGQLVPVTVVEDLIAQLG